jgi:hypothetical protein
MLALKPQIISEQLDYLKPVHKHEEPAPDEPKKDEPKAKIVLGSPRGRKVPMNGGRKGAW